MTKTYPKPDPRDARIAEIEKHLAEWKQATAITQEAIEIQRRIGDTKAAILTAERDAARADVEKRIAAAVRERTEVILTEWQAPLSESKRRPVEQGFADWLRDLRDGKVGT